MHILHSGANKGWPMNAVHTETQPVALDSSSPAVRQSVADLVVEHLVGEGVKTVFGIPGGATIPFHQSLERHPDIEFVLASHEGGAAFMADCYARTSGKLGVCCATTGPGATNLLTGVAAAYVDSVPMLVITGMNALDSWGRLDFQESSPYAGVDTTSIFSHVCKRSEVVVSEKTIQFRLRNAIATALSGRPGPVHLAIPRDLWNKQISPELWDRVHYLPRPPAPLMEDVETTARLLADAERPLILYGSGASLKAAGYLAEISERMNIPMLTTPRAKGKGIANVPPTLLGNTGISSPPVAEELLRHENFDVVLVVGAGFGSYSTNSWDLVLRPSRAMIQVNIDPDAIGRVYQADLGLVADGETFSEALWVATHGLLPGKKAEERRLWLDRYRGKERWYLPNGIRDAESETSPLEIVSAVDRAAGEHSIVMADSNSILLWATCHLPERPNRRFVGVWGSASMGHVTAGAIGAKLANPSHDVIAMVGDGCFLMNGNEVATAANLKLPIVWVVNANWQLGMIHYELRSSFLTKSATLGSYDIAGLATSLGANGIHYQPRDDLAELIRNALKQNGPTVIQVDVDPHLPPPLGMKKEGSRRWQEYVKNL